MFQGFLVGCEKGGMEDRVDFPLRGDTETESCLGDDFLNFKWTSSFHLEFPWSIHMEVGHFKPDLVSYSPGGELGGYLFLHLLLSHFMGGLGIISGSGQVRKSTF